MTSPSKDDLEGDTTLFGSEQQPLRVKDGEPEREIAADESTGNARESVDTLKHTLGDAFEDAGYATGGARDRLRD